MRVLGGVSMRKGLWRVNEKTLDEVLTLLGYTRCGKGDLEWRRVQFHVFIRKGKRGAALSIHEDAASSLPPFHTAKHRSKALEMELAKIVDAYRKMRMPTR
jgi:hypothetical protein